MPVVEELVAVLGFRVQGLDEVRKFDAFLLRTRKGLDAFGTALNTKLARLGAGGGSALGRFNASLKAGVSSTAMMAAGTARLAAALVGVGTAASVVVGVVAKLAHAYAKARAEAALLRNEERFKAVGHGTNMTNLEKMGRGFRSIGLKDEVAEKFVEEIGKKAIEARAEPDDDKLFGPNKIRVRGAGGKAADSSGVALDVIKAYLDLRTKAREADAKAGQGGRGAKAAAGSAAKFEDRAEALAKEAKFPAELIGALQALKGWPEFVRRMTEANDANPPESKRNVDRANAFGDRFIAVANELEGVFTGLSRRIDQVGMVIEESILPPLEAFAHGLNSVARTMGLIEETKNAREARQEMERETERGKSTMDKPGGDIVAALREAIAQRGNDAALGFFFVDPREKARRRLVEAGDAYRQAHGAEVGGLGRRSPEEQDRYRAKSDSAASELLDAYRAVKDMIGLGAQQKALAQPPATKSIENVGNDQRTININTSVPVTVVPNVGAIGPAAASAVDQKVLGAVSTKGANTSTDALTAP